jgi:predicted DNA-binding transcriptional regulator AlpA
MNIETAVSGLPNKPYLAPKEVADFYGFPVKTLYGWIAEGKVPADRIGPSKVLRIKREVAEQLAQPVVS